MLKTSKDSFLELSGQGLRVLLSDEVLIADISQRIQKQLADIAWNPSSDSAFFDFAAKCDRLVQHFAKDGMTREILLHVAVRRLCFFCQKPETLIGNIEGVMKHLGKDGKTRRQYLCAALAQPQLFYQKPTTLIRNFEQVAAHVSKEGVPRDDYVRAALLQPQLFFHNPATIVRHIDIIVAMYRRGLFAPYQSRRPVASGAPTVLRYLMSSPRTLLISEENLLLREIYARLVDPPPPISMLKWPRKKIEDELTHMLGLSPATRDDALLAMIAHARERFRRNH
jgi:hypothetical protein